MAKDYRRKLTGQIGEHLVVAELGRQGIVATPFAGNMPDVDLLAWHRGQSVGIQVKAVKTGSAQLDARSLLVITFQNGVQRIEGLQPVNRDQLWVLVMVGAQYGQDTFYVFTLGQLQDAIHDAHGKVLDACNGRRTRNPESTHCSWGPEKLPGTENQWRLIWERLGIPQAERPTL